MKVTRVLAWSSVESWGGVSGGGGGAKGCSLHNQNVSGLWFDVEKKLLPLTI